MKREEGIQAALQRECLLESLLAETRAAQGFRRVASDLGQNRHHLTNHLQRLLAVVDHVDAIGEEAVDDRMRIGDDRRAGSQPFEQPRAHDARLLMSLRREGQTHTGFVDLRQNAVSIERNGAAIVGETFPRLYSVKLFRSVDIDQVGLVEPLEKVVMAASLTRNPFPIDADVEKPGIAIDAGFEKGRG